MKAKIKIKKYGIYAALVIITLSVVIMDIVLNAPKKKNQILYTPSTHTDSEIEETEISESVTSKKTSEKSAAAAAAATKEAKTTAVTSAPVETKTEQTTAVSSETQVTEPPEKAVEFPIDVNKVTKEELMKINGIGEKLADKIISYRNDVSVIYNMDMLANISGIGDKKLEMLKQYLYVSQAQYKDMPTVKTTVSEAPVTKEETQSVTVPSESESLKTTTTQTTEEPTRQKVNINKATAQEISQKLLIDLSSAEAIIELRELITYFQDPRELLHTNKFTEKQLDELREYIEI